MSLIPSACKYHVCVGAYYAFFVCNTRQLCPGMYFVKRAAIPPLSRWLMSRYHADRMRKYLSKRNIILLYQGFAFLRSSHVFITRKDIIDRMISIIFINPSTRTRKDKLCTCKYRPWVYRTTCSARTYYYSRLFSLELIGASKRGAGARGRCKYSSEIDQSCKPPRL